MLWINAVKRNERFFIGETVEIFSLYCTNPTSIFLDCHLGVLDVSVCHSDTPF